MAKDNLKAEDVHIIRSNANQSALYKSMFGQVADVGGEDKYCKVLIDELHDFPNHPFKVINDEEMSDLRDSIVDNGLINPIIIRPRIEGGYTILSGHRRVFASKLANKMEIEAILKNNLTDEQATIFMVDSNKQREIILPSERAKSYAMKMDAIKCQINRGRPSKEKERPGGANLKSDSILAEEEGVAARTVNRYVRINYLIPQLQELVDNDARKARPSMGLKPGVEISYLKEEEQKYFYDTVKTLEATPSVSQATEIKNLSKNGELTQTKVMQILCVAKPNQRETVKIDSNILNDRFKEKLTSKELEVKVIENIDSYSKIKQTVAKYTKKNLSDDEIVTMVDNLLKKYIDKNKHKDYER